MKLIEALIMAQNVYGIYSDWKAIHSTRGFLGLSPYGLLYLAYDASDRLISQSERLETVITGFAQCYAETMHDDQWKVSRWEP